MIEIKELSKKYDGVCALQGLELAWDTVGIFGILGGEGSGKTTLARIMCGCEDCDTGYVSFDGRIISRRTQELRKKVRLVPSDITLYSVTTPCEYLDVVGDAIGVPSEKRYRQIKEAIELTELDGVKNAPFSSLTKYQRTLLSIAASLMGNPEYIVLDTPFSGIENRSLEKIYDILTMLGGIKKIVLTSSSPKEIKRFCQSVAVINGGKTVVCGNIAEIEAKLNSTSQIYITVRGDSEQIMEAVRALDGVINVGLNSTQPNNVCVYSVEYKRCEDMKDRLYSALSKINAPMLSVRSVTLSIDDIFYSFSSSSTDKKGADKESKTKGRGRQIR